jgi:hypothetical protein
VIRTRVLLTRIEDWGAVAAVHGEFFRNVRPASTVVQVSRFIDPGGSSRSKPMPLCRRMRSNEGMQPRALRAALMPGVMRHDQLGEVSKWPKN